MTAELHLVRRCEEHGEVDEHCLHADGLVKRGDEACSEGYCPGGSVVVLDPEQVVDEMRLHRATDWSARCPNKWRCKDTCNCHKLSDSEYIADLEAHFLVPSRTRPATVADLIRALTEGKN